MKGLVPEGGNPYRSKNGIAVPGWVCSHQNRSWNVYAPGGAEDPFLSMLPWGLPMPNLRNQALGVNRIEPGKNLIGKIDRRRE